MKPLILIILLGLIACAEKPPAPEPAEFVDKTCISIEKSIELRWEADFILEPVQVDLCNFDGAECLLFQALNTDASHLDCIEIEFNPTRVVIGGTE